MRSAIRKVFLNNFPRFLVYRTRRTSIPQIHLQDGTRTRIVWFQSGHGAIPVFGPTRRESIEATKADLTSVSSLPPTKIQVQFVSRNTSQLRAIDTDNDNTEAP